jgi:hypothetical protein
MKLILDCNGEEAAIRILSTLSYTATLMFEPLILCPKHDIWNGERGIISLLFSGGLGERECILYCKNMVERPADNEKKDYI